MTQNINLYTPRPKRAADHFSRPGLALIAAALVAGAALLAHGEHTRLGETRLALERTGAEAERLQRLLAAVSAPGADLRARIEAQEAEVIALERSAARVASGVLARSAGFSAPLQSLGRTTTEGVWLTAIRIDNDRGSLMLEGRALAAERVPVFIAGLGRDALLARTPFAALELKALSEAAAETEAAPAQAVQFRLQGVPRAPAADPRSAPASTQAHGAGR